MQRWPSGCDRPPSRLHESATAPGKPGWQQGRTPGHSITGFAIAANGALTILDANGRKTATGAGSFPMDLDTSADGGFLYVLAAGTDCIVVYAIGAGWSLSQRPSIGGLPGAANGLVAR